MNPDSYENMLQAVQTFHDKHEQAGIIALFCAQALETIMPVKKIS